MVRGPGAGAGVGAETGSPAGGATGLRLLLSAPILLGVLFFFGISVAGYGIHSFSVSALHLIHHAPIAEATTVLTAYLFATPVGVLAGGWVADRIRRRHDAFAATCLVVVAVCIGAVATLRPPLALVALLFVFAGFFSGMVAPSRDMLIRSMSPPGEIAKVFGFVSTGFNFGGDRRARDVRLPARSERPRHRVLDRRPGELRHRLHGIDHREGEGAAPPALIRLRHPAPFRLPLSGACLRSEAGHDLARERLDGVALRFERR